MEQDVRRFRSARRHRVGEAHTMHDLQHVEPVRDPATETLDARSTWVGVDDRGPELEIMALDLPDAVVVIHVMPTDLRR